MLFPFNDQMNHILQIFAGGKSILNILLNYANLMRINLYFDKVFDCL